MPKLWSLEEVAQYTSYGITVARRVVSQPDFPKPVRVYNGAHPRWIAREVIEYCEAKKEAA